MRLSTLLANGRLREKVEVHERIVFSVMPLLFVLLGSGIGIKLKQQSKMLMLHIGLGGGITLLFLQFIILGETLSYAMGTPLLTWIPVLLFMLLGGISLKWK